MIPYALFISLSLTAAVHAEEIKKFGLGHKGKPATVSVHYKIEDGTLAPGFNSNTITAAELVGPNGKTKKLALPADLAFDSRPEQLGLRAIDCDGKGDLDLVLSHGSAKGDWYDRLKFDPKTSRFASQLSDCASEASDD